MFFIIDVVETNYSLSLRKRRKLQCWHYRKSFYETEQSDLSAKFAPLTKRASELRRDQCGRNLISEYHARK